MSTNASEYRVSLESETSEDWRVVLKFLEVTMNKQTKLLRRNDCKPNSIIVFQVDGSQYIAACNQDDYVDICCLPIVRQEICNVKVCGDEEKHHQYPIPFSMIQEVKQPNSRPRLVITNGVKYFMYRIQEGPNVGKVAVQEVKNFQCESTYNLKSAVFKVNHPQDQSRRIESMTPPLQINVPEEKICLDEQVNQESEVVAKERLPQQTKPRSKQSERVILEGAPKDWQPVVQELENLMNQSPNILRNFSDDPSSVLRFHANGCLFIATCSRAGYVHICLLCLVGKALCDVMFNDQGEVHHKYPISLSVIQKVKQSEFKSRLVITESDEYLVHLIQEGSNAGKVEVLEVKRLECDSVVNLRSAVLKANQAVRISSEHDVEPKQVESMQKSPQITKQIPSAPFEPVNPLMLPDVSLDTKEWQQQLIEQRDSQSVYQKSAEPFPGWPQLIQAMEHDIKNSLSYICGTNDKFRLYKVENQFYLVTRDESGCININPLDIVGHFDSVDAINSQFSNTMVNLLTSMTTGELCDKVRNKTTVKPAKQVIQIEFGMPLVKFYEAIRQVPKPTRFEENTRLDLMSRLLEPLKFDQALRFQACGGFLREAIVRTKWKFSMRGFISLLKPLTSLRYNDYKTTLYQVAPHLMALICAWLPYVRHLVYDRHDHDIYTVIYMCIITDSSWFTRLEMQPYNSNYSKSYPMQVALIRSYTVDHLKQLQRKMFSVSELITSLEFVESSNTLLRWIKLVHRRVTRLEWPVLFESFPEKVSTPSLPNLQSLSVIYSEATANRAINFVETNRTLLELDVTWIEKKPSNLGDFFTKFLAPIQNTLLKFRLIFQWNLPKKNLKQAITSLSEVTNLQMNSLTHLELGLYGIPTDLLNVICPMLTCAPNLQTLVFIFTRDKCFPTFPLQISSRISNNVLKHVVIDFSRLTYKESLIDVINKTNMFQVDTEKTCIKTLNLTFNQVQRGDIYTDSIVMVNNFTICSTLQIQGKVSFTRDNQKLAQIIEKQVDLNHLVLMSNSEQHIWPSNVFEALRQRGCFQKNQHDLRLHGALFYFNYKNVHKNISYSHSMQTFNPDEEDYFRFH